MQTLLCILLKPVQWLLSLLFALLLLGVLALAFAGFYVPFVAEKFVAYRTDFPLNIGSSHLNLFLGEVDLWDVTLKNPVRFHEPLFIEIKELGAHVNLMSMFTDTKQIDRLSIDIPQVSWVKSANGEVNTDAFVNSFTGTPSEKEEPVQKTTTPSGTKSSEPLKYVIKELNIHIGTIHKVDYTQSGAKSKSYPVNIDLKLKDVKGPEDVVGPLTLALATSGVAFLTDTIKEMIPTDLTKPQGIVDKGGQAIQKGASAVTDAAKNLLNLF